MGLAIDYISSATLLQSECEKIEKLSDFLAPMTIAELFPALRELTRADKLKVMQFLIAELAKKRSLL